jgi:macrodomain Ter protein organizer (MatP/YcbG family)
MSLTGLNHLFGDGCNQIIAFVWESMGGANNAFFVFPMASRTKFTPAAVEQIVRLLDQGHSPAEIAERLGCKLGTLRLRCSQLGISLRRNRSVKRRRAQMPESQSRLQLTVSLPPAIFQELRQQAAAKGMTESRLVVALLEGIARDDLYAAVLDEHSPHGAG